ncbi:L-iditol 2-dehydrogenase [Variovorax guangxiensis]|uniref:L-iditol 2-dehydrogenase n=1 Tax=Variovorax guangxiensis TaxID=1775474 RepID=UPI00285E069D|nr:L-iditol 2-dehydrogenase [Variovorax guangxiensis]MDR6855045.1 D-sorbitol dehydrogenase (acceptor) [Variovorax guangxiensis]
MSSRLAQRHVLVTGAGGGIGLAIAEACLQQGARCTLVDRSPAPSDGVALLQRSHPGRVGYLPGDVTDANAVAQLLESAQAAAGPIHTLVNNAAVFDMAPLLESDEASFDLLFAVNVKALFFVMQRVLQHMVVHGEAGCSVINMASQAGRRGEALVSHYCATKAAVISYTQSAALAMAPQGIRVNAIAPGVVDTPMWAHVDALFARYEGLPPGEKKRRVGLEVPLGRMGTPDEIAGAAVFLASDEARYITAQTLNVDGGNVMS